MVVYTHKDVLRESIRSEKDSGGCIGFVPTMGALHEGHLSLVRKALKENDLVVVSIFVNPTQFDNQQDLEKYPRIHEADKRLLESLNGRILLFIPEASELYGDKVEAKRYYFDGLEHQMEGAHRKGHFDGVGTVLSLFFTIVEADRAYFGEKDYQQLQIVKKLTEKYSIPVKIIGCPIVREDNGLAMSSRNKRLSPEAFEKASFIYKTLSEAKQKFKSESITSLKEFVKEQFLQHDLLKLEYFEVANERTLVPAVYKRSDNRYRAFIAVHCEEVRLIDNIALY